MSRLERRSKDKDRIAYKRKLDQDRDKTEKLRDQTEERKNMYKKLDSNRDKTETKAETL